jgi:hypothetical protein
MRGIRHFGSVFAVIVLSGSILFWRVEAQSPAPGIPTNISAVVNGSQLTVSWSAPAGGPVPTAYRLDFRFLATGALVAAVQVGAVPSFTVTIPAGTQGDFSVTVTAIGGTAAGAPSSPTPFQIGAGPGGCTGAPLPPAALRFTRVDTRLNMEWNPSAGASEYIIEAGSVSGGRDIHVGSAGLNTTFTAIIPVATHAFVRVLARNACGTSLRGDEIEIGAIWSVSFPRLSGLNANTCVAGVAPGGFCSQNLQLRSFGQFEEIWSPGTPVMRVQGVMTSTQITATIVCLNGAASGTLQGTWNGERYVGTATLGGSSTSMLVTPGNYDPDCLR